jgi:hypothetical protein
MRKGKGRDAEGCGRREVEGERRNGEGMERRGMETREEKGGVKGHTVSRSIDLVG